MRAISLAAAERNEVGRPIPPAAAFGVNEEDRAWVDSKTTQQPTFVALQPIALTGARERVAKKSYIRAAAYPSPVHARTVERLKTDPTWRLYDVPCGHDVMVDMPERLVEILIEVA
jgi:hypothetical protein